MAEEWHKTILDNKHDEINDFLKRKKSTGNRKRVQQTPQEVLPRTLP
ncbi:MAG: hypothetical protein U5J64_08065 [Halobacteriales archaeon]|nr:hypothetical protein [Halobacteriales archaeon]